MEALVPKKQAIDMSLTNPETRLTIVPDKKLNADLLYESKDSIRRHKNGKVSLVSIRKIGQPIFIEDFNYADIQKAVMFLQESPSLTHPQSLNTLI